MPIWFCASHEWPSGITISDFSPLSDIQEGGRLCRQRASVSHLKAANFHQVILLSNKGNWVWESLPKVFTQRHFCWKL